MPLSINVRPGKGGRRALRRAVSMECEILSDLWDDTVLFHTTDLSHLGLWVETQLPLEKGEEVIVSFSPPSWPHQEPIVALALVSRVGLYRRRYERHESGMGLALMDLRPQESRLLQESLHGLPPPIPLKMNSEYHASQPVIDPQRPVFPLDDEPIIELLDGSLYRLASEGPLLTGARRPIHDRLSIDSMATLLPFGPAGKPSLFLPAAA